MQAAATKSNVDYAVQAKSALAAIERFSDEIEAVPQKTGMCREKWRDYGAALLAQRLLIPSDQQFGGWIKANALDQGRASDRTVRSNAMWLAEHFDSVVTNYSGGSHDPTIIRQQCRDSGYDWAGETKHQAERKETSVRAKAKSKRYSWTTVARQEGIAIERGGSQRQHIQAALREIDGAPDLFGAPNEARLRAALATFRAKQGDGSAIVVEARASVNESAQMRFDKALAKAVAAETERLRSQFLSELHREIEARIAPELEAERKRAREMFERNQRELQNFVARRDGIKQAITKKDFQLVLNCLHPDRAPDDRKTKYAEAFRIVKALQPYIDSFEE